VCVCVCVCFFKKKKRVVATVNSLNTMFLKFSKIFLYHTLICQHVSYCICSVPYLFVVFFSPLYIVNILQRRLVHTCKYNSDLPGQKKRKRFALM